MNASAQEPVVRVWWGDTLIDQRFVPKGRTPHVEAGLRAELSNAALPEQVASDPLENFRDFAVPVLLLSCLFAALVLAVMPTITGEGTGDGDSYGDDGERGRQRKVLSKYLDRRSAPASAAAFAKREAIIVTPKPTSGATPTRTISKKQPRDEVKDAKQLVKELFAGIGPLVATDSTQLEAAMRNLKAAGDGVASGSLGDFGQGSRGLGGGSGGGLGDAPWSPNSGTGLGIGSLATRGRGGGTGGYGSGVGVLIGKKDTDIGISMLKPRVIGSLDKDLIRKVMRQHQSEIRYCYELARTTHPEAQGRVTVKFAIAPTGDVAAANISESFGDSTLDACIVSRVRTFKFPAPNGGGVVIVNWPWQFLPAGE